MFFSEQSVEGTHIEFEPTQSNLTITLTLTLTFDLFTPKPCSLVPIPGYPKVIPYAKFEHWDHLFPRGQHH